MSIQPSPDKSATKTRTARLTHVQRAMRWFHYISRGGAPVLVSMVSAILLIFNQITFDLWSILLVAVMAYLLYLYTAPVIRNPQDPVDEALKLTLPLTWLCFFWTLSALAKPMLPALTLPFALGAGVVLSLVPQYLLPFLLLIIACLELSLVVNAQLSVGLASFHVAAHFLSVTTLPRLLSKSWFIRACYPGLIDTSSLPLSHRYFDSSIFSPKRRTHDSSDQLNRAPISTSTQVIDGLPIMRPQQPGSDVYQDPAFEASWNHAPVQLDDRSLQRSQVTSLYPAGNDFEVNTEENGRELRAAVEPAVENITGLVRSYSPIEGMPALREVLREHNLRAASFINRSLEVHLKLLRQQLNVDSAVLLWIKGQERCLGIRAADSIRDTFTRGPYQITDGILEEALRESLRFDEPIEAYTILPYYDRSVTLGGLLSTPVYLSHPDLADGILIVDRSSQDPWEQHAHAALKMIADKISLDLETSQLLRQVTHDAGQVEQLCYCLRRLNEAFSLDEVERCVVESVSVYDGFESASYYALQEGDELRLKARWVHPELCDALGHSLDELPKLGSTFSLGDDILSRSICELREYSTLFDPASPSHYLPHDEWTLDCAAGVMVTPLRDPHSERVSGALLLTSSTERAISHKALIAFRLLTEQLGVKLSLVNAHERLKVMASIDWLTGLKNHMTFQSESREMLNRAQRDQSALSFILLDIDHFKSVNDTYGHPFGDLVLRRVADTLRQEVRDVDLVARYGGEEFAIVLHATELERALVSVERVRRSVESLVFDFEGEEVRVSISLGVACYPIDSRQQERLVDKADKALYQSKRNGRNQVTAWRAIAPDEQDSSVSWTRAPTHYIDDVEDEYVSDGEGRDVNALLSAGAHQGTPLSFDLEDLINADTSVGLKPQE